MSTLADTVLTLDTVLARVDTCWRSVYTRRHVLTLAPSPGRPRRACELRTRPRVAPGGAHARAVQKPHQIAFLLRFLYATPGEEESQNDQYGFSIYIGTIIMAHTGASTSAYAPAPSRAPSQPPARWRCVRNQTCVASGQSAGPRSSPLRIGGVLGDASRLHAWHYGCPPPLRRRRASNRPPPSPAAGGARVREGGAARRGGVMVVDAQTGWTVHSMTTIG